MKASRILIADDHEMVRQGLRAVIASRAGWEVCGEAITGREAVAAACKLRPDVVILDVTMPELNGLEAARQIHQALPVTEVLILTAHDSEELVRQVLVAGARGYVLKNDAGRVLVQAVETLLQHRPFFTSKVSEFVLTDGLNPKQASRKRAAERRRLTPREREIVRLIAEGRSSKEMAADLGISVKTAETHRTNILRKLKFHSVSELVRYAIRNFIIEA